MMLSMLILLTYYRVLYLWVMSIKSLTSVILRRHKRMLSPVESHDISLSSFTNLQKCLYRKLFSMIYLPVFSMKQKLLLRLKVNIGGCDYATIYKWDTQLWIKDNEIVLFFKGRRELLYYSELSVCSTIWKKKCWTTKLKKILETLAGLRRIEQREFFVP